MGFENYFSLPKKIWRVNVGENELGKIFPGCWGWPFPTSAQKAIGHSGITRLNRDKSLSIDKALTSNADTFVVCRYVADYSDLLFDSLSVTGRVGKFLSEYFESLPSIYDCWHLRNTDKTGDEMEEVLRLMHQRVDLKPQVLITDCIFAKEQAKKLGIVCPSRIVETKIGQGVHHADAAQLKRIGITKDEINLSLIADLFVAGRCDEFFPTCPTSTFSRFIVRGRQCGWFSKDQCRLNVDPVS